MKNTKNRGDEKQLLNPVLAKFLGFYQILDPEKRLGRVNVYRCVLVFLVFYECLMAALMCLNGLYYWTNNVTESIFYFGFALNVLYESHKMCLVLYYSEQIWRCTSVVRFDFTSHYASRHAPDAWRKRSIGFTYTTTAMLFASTVVYVAYPLVFGDTLIVMTNRDGSSGRYRLNVFNLYLFVPEHAYGAYFNVFYALETVCCAVIALFVVTFDLILTTLCLAMTCQLEMISAAFESVGHKTSLRSPANGHSIDNKKKICNEYNLDVFSDLKNILMDHQRVLKKYDEFLTLFRRTMLMEMFVLSSSIIMFCFIFLASLLQGKFAGVTLMKSILTFPFIIQFFGKCYYFENLQDKKDSIIFALYSSNWTEMNMKCKKLILFIMKMNNAHQQKLQYTTTRAVNLDLFYRTMRTCYTIISVLVKTIRQK